MRVRFVVEGETEEALVRSLLIPHLRAHGIACAPHQDILVARGNKWRIFHGLIDASLRGLGKQWGLVTTLYDLYGIDQSNLQIEDAYARAAQPREKARIAETAMARAVGASDRFLPHVSLYEIETLVFADLARSVEVRPEWEGGIENLARKVKAREPESIDDTRETSPSHRLIDALPGFDKVADVPLILEKIGLETIRDRCPHFDAWLRVIEDRSSASRSSA